MPISTPPPKQLALLLVIDRFRLRVPQWVGLVALAVLVPSGAWMALGDWRGGAPAGPVPMPGPQVPVMATTLSPFQSFAPVAQGVLPSPGPNQIKKAQRCFAPAAFRRGGCWIAIADEKPPCTPQRNTWPEDGKCWFPVAEAAPMPTTGDLPTLPVAAPE